MYLTRDALSTGCSNLLLSLRYFGKAQEPTYKC